MAAARFLLHHAPNSRSERILWALEEAGCGYDIHWHDLGQGTQKEPAYLAVNPAGKVPALEDRGPDGDWQGVIVLESQGICGYLADVVPEAGLAPLIGTPARGLYASWLSVGGAVLEPAFADLAFPRAEPPPARALGWGPMSEVMERIEHQLEQTAFIAGERFSAADLMVGGLLQWGVSWGKLTPGPATRRYLASLDARPALARAKAKKFPPG